jgi:hypothetical protein
MRVDRSAIAVAVFFALASACGGATTGQTPAAPSSSSGAAAGPACVAPGGHAGASGSGVAGSAHLQVDFRQPCDLTVRVSAVDLTVRFDGLNDVTLVRITEGRLPNAVNVYDARFDGPPRSPFSKQLVGRQAAISLDDIHAAICGGNATFEVLFAGGASSLQTPILPSNTGKC